jgi:hypothetical protein
MGWGEEDSRYNPHSYNGYKSAKITSEIIKDIKSVDINEKYSYITLETSRYSFELRRNESYKNLSTYGYFNIQQDGIYDTGRWLEEDEIILSFCREYSHF